MKIFKYLVLLTALLAAAFLAVGAMNPVVEYRTEVEIAKSPQDAWETFMNSENMAAWVTGFERLEVLSGEPGEIGTEYMLYLKEKGREITVRETATVVEPGRRYGFDMDNDWLSGSSLISLDAGNVGTRLSIDNTVRGKGIINRAMLFLMRSKMQERQQGDIEKLRDLIESV